MTTSQTIDAIKVSATTNPNKLAGSIAYSLEQCGKVECFATGRQAVKILMFAVCVLSTVAKRNITAKIEFAESKEECAYVVHDVQGNEKTIHKFKLKATLTQGS